MYYHCTLPVIHVYFILYYSRPSPNFQCEIHRSTDINHVRLQNSAFLLMPHTFNVRLFITTYSYVYNNHMCIFRVG